MAVDVSNVTFAGRRLLEREQCSGRQPKLRVYYLLVCEPIRLGLPPLCTLLGMLCHISSGASIYTREPNIYISKMLKIPKNQSNPSRNPACPCNAAQAMQSPFPPSMQEERETMCELSDALS